MSTVTWKCAKSLHFLTQTRHIFIGENVESSTLYLSTVSSFSLNCSLFSHSGSNEYVWKMTHKRHNNPLELLWEASTMLENGSWFNGKDRAVCQLMYWLPLYCILDIYVKCARHSMNSDCAQRYIYLTHCKFSREALILSLPAHFRDF